MNKVICKRKQNISRRRCSSGRKRLKWTDWLGFRRCPGSRQALVLFRRDRKRLILILDFKKMHSF